MGCDKGFVVTLRVHVDAAGQREAERVAERAANEALLADPRIVTVGLLGVEEAEA